MMQPAMRTGHDIVDALVACFGWLWAYAQWIGVVELNELATLALTVSLIVWTVIRIIDALRGWDTDEVEA